MQTTKTMPPNPELMAAMQEKRRSNATVPHKNKRKYDRKRDRAALRKGVW